MRRRNYLLGLSRQCTDAQGILCTSHWLCLSWIKVTISSSRAVWEPLSAPQRFLWPSSVLLHCLSLGLWGPWRNTSILSEIFVSVTSVVAEAPFPAKEGGWSHLQWMLLARNVLSSGCYENKNKKKKPYLARYGFKHSLVIIWSALTALLAFSTLWKHHPCICHYET